MLRLLGRITSINVRKVAWALDEMGTAYEREDWGKPLRDPHEPEFLALNPNAQVPVLVDGELVLWESNAVLRYVAGRAGSDLWPADLAERGRVDQWMTWQSTELNPAWSYAARAMLRAEPPNPDPARIAESLAAWTGKMRLLETEFTRTGDYIANGRFSLADIVLGVSVHRWYSVAFDKPDLPATADYLARLKARPAAAPYLTAATP
jgi:glutathione S-transferase